MTGEQRQQAARFLEVHKWAPPEHAAYLAGVKVGEPFCDECADWHTPDEEHSQP